MTKRVAATLAPFFLTLTLLIVGFALDNLKNLGSPATATWILYSSIIPFVIGIFLIILGAKKSRGQHTVVSESRSEAPSFESLRAEVSGSHNITVVGDRNTVVMEARPARDTDLSIDSTDLLRAEANRISPLSASSSSGSSTTTDDMPSGDSEPRAQEVALLYDRLQSAKLMVDSGRHIAAIDALTRLRAEAGEASLPAEFHATLANRIGVAYLGTNRLEDAEDELRAAIRIRPNHRKALTNLASLRLRNGDPNGALRITDGILDDIGGNPIIGVVRIHALHELQRDDEIDAFSAQFPDTATTPAVRAAVAQIRLAGDRSEEALSLAREVVRAEPSDPSHKLLLGQCLLATVIAGVRAHPPVPWLMDSGLRGRVHEASSVLTVAIEDMEKREEPEPLRSALLNRAHARMILQDFDEALHDCLRARTLGPDDDHLRQRMAPILLLTGQPLEAQELLSAIENQDVRDALLPQRASALMRASRVQEAIELLRPQWDAASENSLPVDIGSMLVEAYAISENDEEAVAVLHKLQSNRKTDRRILEVSARFAARTGRTVDAENLYQDALREAEPNDKDWIALDYADFLSANGHFSRSVEFYEGRVPVDRSSPYLSKYLVALWNADRLARLFEVTAKLRAAGVTEEIVDELHARCLIEAGDMAGASDTWRCLINGSDSPSRYRLEAAVTAFRAGDQEQAGQFASQISIQDLASEPSALMQLAQLRHALELDDVLPCAYAAWRQAPRDAKMHGSYIQILQSREDIQSELLASTLPQVAIDTTVFLQYEEHQTVFTIHSRMPPNPTDEDISDSDPTAAKLLGRRVGDTIDFGAGRSLEITEIRSKYAVAASRAMTGFEGRFPDNRAIQSFSVDPEFSALRERVMRRNEFIENVVELYRDRTIPLATASQMTGASVIDVWGTLTNRANEEILAWQGDTSENRETIELVKQGVAVLDSTGLLALATVGRLDTLRAVVPQLVVPQAVLDEFTEHYMLTYQGKKPAGHVSSEGKRLTYALHSEEDWQRGKEFVENIIRFITSHTEQVPALSYLRLDPEDRRKLKDMIGKSALMPMLVAAELRSPLYSDDHLLRALARNEYDVRGIWSGAVMAAARGSGNLSSDDYSKSICSFMSMNYYNVPVESSDLVWVFKHEGQQASDLFRRVTGQLGAPHCDEASAVAVAAEATKLALTTLALFDRKQVFVDELIRALLTGRRGTSILKQYKRHLRAIASRPALPESYWAEIDRLINNRS